MSNDSHKITVLTFNINTDIATLEEGYARDSFHEFRVNNRIKFILKALRKIIRSDHPDLIHLQECVKFKTKFGDTVDSLTEISEFFKKKGYNIIVRPYNEEIADKFFYYLTAYNPKRLYLKKHYSKYFNKTPDKVTIHPTMIDKTKQQQAKILSGIKRNNYGVLRERSILIAKFLDLNTATIIYSLNVHLDLLDKVRIKSVKLINKFLKEIIKESPLAKIIIAGDFNTFPDWKGPQQLKLISNLVKEATDNLKLPNGQKATFSFIAFPCVFIMLKNLNLQTIIQKMQEGPHKDEAIGALTQEPNHNFNDKVKLYKFLLKLSPFCRRLVIKLIFQENSTALGGILDRVFIRGFYEVKKCILLPIKLYSKPIITSFNNEKQVKKYILSHEGPAFPSDHQPIIVTLLYSELY